MERLTDRQIVQQMGSADQKEVDFILEYVYVRMYPFVLRFIERNRGGQADAEDVFQDGLIKFYKLVRQGRIAEEVNVEAYLYTICRNIWLKKLGREKKPDVLIEDIEIVPVEDTILQRILSKEKEAHYQLMLQQLGKDCYKVLMAYYYKNLPLKIIATEMNYSSEAVAKNKKSGCMKKLRQLLIEIPSYKKHLQ
ncbi:MAG: sigma-70 family RNA polymerase sigma factor [Bacteroidota bacterium]